MKHLCLRNRDGSYATQYARERILTMVANQLHEMGYRDMPANWDELMEKAGYRPLKEFVIQ